MSHSAPVAVSEDLVASFRSASSSSRVRFIQATLEDESIVEVFAHNRGSSLEEDFSAMVERGKEGQAAYFLFRLKDGEESWLLITFVPEGVTVKDKMLYASAKGTLKDKLGHAHFVEEHHATSKEELSYQHFKGSLQPADSRSEAEKMHDLVLEQEEEVREEQQQKLVANDEKRSSGNLGSGGYHSVSIPLSSSAKAELDRLKSGQINFLQLSINDAKTEVNAPVAKAVSSMQEAEKEIHTAEPRFYVYTHTRGGSPSNVFVYCCPEKAPPKLRMVYSTAKLTVAGLITQHGVALAPKKIEIRDPVDLGDELKDSNMSVKPSAAASGRGGLTGRMITPSPNSSSSPAFGGTVKAAKQSSFEASHPIYSLMNPQGLHDPKKKKIVIPPRAAWSG